MFKVAYNPTDSPVVVDAEGRTIGGHEWDAADDAAPEVGQALGGGQLVWTDDSDDPNTEVQAAIANVAQRNQPAGRGGGGRRAAAPDDSSDENKE